MFVKKIFPTRPDFSAAETAPTNTNETAPLGVEMENDVPAWTGADEYFERRNAATPPLWQGIPDPPGLKAALKSKAVKYDSGKPPLGLIPKSALDAEALVMAHGANKYSRDNWRKGMHWSRLVDAALRHITAFNEGETLDPESGLHHLAHARCCLAFLIEYQAKEAGTDDRYVDQE